MSKRAATAALLIALGFGSQSQAGAEQSVDLNQKFAVDKTLIAEQQSGYQTGFSANQSQSKSQTWQLDPKTGISTPVWSTKGSPAGDTSQTGTTTSGTATSSGAASGSTTSATATAKGAPAWNRSIGKNSRDQEKR